MDTRIIVNADDVGRSQIVNDHTFALMDAGKVTSATIVAGGAAFNDVARRCRNYPHCSFGVHLYLDDFAPLTNFSAFDCLRESGGRFKSDARTYKFTSGLRKAFLSEWLAQIDRVCSAGIPVSHLDSHHHVHTIPAMFGVLKELQRRTGLRKVRISRNCYSADEPASFLRLLKKRIFNFALRHYVPTITTTHFTAFGSFNALLKSGRALQPRSIELMVHPGAATYINEPARYEAELVELNRPWTANLPWTYTFINYNDLL